MGESAPNVIAYGAEEALRCLRCGYDLRGFATERCSECGWEIDRDLLSGGSFPWEFRRYRGRFLSYLKTVWTVSIGSRSLADAPKRRHELADAKNFARTTGVIVGVVLVGVSFLIFKDVGLWRMVIQPDWSWPPRAPRPVWIEDVGVPWSAGVTLLPVGPLVLAAFALYVTRAPKRLFAMKGADPSAAKSGEAIGCYAAAPMAWLPLATLFLLGSSDFRVGDWSGYFAPALVAVAVVVALWGVVMRVRQGRTRKRPNIWFMPMTWLAAGLMLLVAFGFGILDWDLNFEGLGRLAHMLVAVSAGAIVLLTMVRIIQWAARVRGWGVGRAMLAVPQLLLIWLLGAVFFLGLLPWCIGFIWLVIDSFR